MCTSTIRSWLKSMKRSSVSGLPALVILIALLLFSSPSLLSAGQAAEGHATAISGAAWQVQFVLDQADQQKLIETASRGDSGLAAKGISLSAAHSDNGLLHPVFTGTGADQLRALLFGSVASRAGAAGGPFTIKVAGKVVKDQLITIVLEANPSTGYTWEVARSSSLQFAEQGPHQFEGAGGPGSRVKQRIVLKALKNGSSTVNLVYRRPFDPDEKAVANISMDMADIPEVVDLSNPVRPAVSASPADKATGRVARVPSKLPDAPSDYSDWTYFDWRERGGTTKIKDQKTCGSCWAFATNGVLESSLRKTYGLEFDLSEQFLVSCNTDGMSCSGGNWAHDYHLTATNPDAKLGDLQVTYGAVLEKDMPYKAADIDCKTIDKHPIWMDSWTEITGTAATDDDIKNLIYTYGPVGVSVCVGPAFQAYKTGVFSTDESSLCETNNNHAVVLVGWDDATNTWILRNSWGAKFGEKGYMNILRGISNVAKELSYLENPAINCSYKINPGLKTVAYNGAIVSVGVTSSTLCPAPEISIPAVITGTAWVDVLNRTWNGQTGSVKLKVHANDASNFTRSISVTIGSNYPSGSMDIALKQTGAPCKITSITAASPAPATFLAIGGAGSFSVVVSPSDCQWVPSGLPYYWIDVPATPEPLSGSQTVNYTVAAMDETGGTSRSGKITVTLGNSKKGYLNVKQNR